jgi:DNA-binding beta-propeller fold protein YncE
MPSTCRRTGEPQLPPQSSIALSQDGRHLLVVNAGSDELSLLAVGDGTPRLSDRVASGGATPTSVAVDGDLAYVLNNRTPNIVGFRIERGTNSISIYAVDDRGYGSGPTTFASAGQTP